MAAQLRSPANALAVVFAVAVAFVAVAAFSAGTASAQDFEMALAPAPLMDSGSSHSFPISAAILLASVAFSLLALAKH